MNQLKEHFARCSEHREIMPTAEFTISEVDRRVAFVWRLAGPHLVSRRWHREWHLG